MCVWGGYRKEGNCFWSIVVVCGLLLVGGFASGLGLRSSNQVLGWILTGLSAAGAVAGVVGLLTSFSVRQARERIEKWLLTRILRSQEAAIGIDIQDKE